MKRLLLVCLLWSSAALAAPESAELRAHQVEFGRYRDGQLSYRLQADELALARRPVFRVFGVRGLFRYELDQVAIESHESDPFAALSTVLEAPLPVLIRGLKLRQFRGGDWIEIAADQAQSKPGSATEMLNFRLHHRDLDLEAPQAFWNPSLAAFEIPGTYVVKNRRGQARASGLRFSLDFDFSSIQ